MSDPEDEPTDESTESGEEPDGEREPTDGTNLPDEGEVEEERAERLDPDNRPEGAEVDNTDREFDENTGFFTDSEGADEAPDQYNPDAE